MCVQPSETGMIELLEIGAMAVQMPSRELPKAMAFALCILDKWMSP